VNTTLSGKLVELRDAYIVLTGPTYVMMPPGTTVENLAVGDLVTVSATWQGGRWTAERVERLEGA
jgi:hypothetical protein